ncbi:diaminopimelate epimerase [Streptomyces coelicoflavus]|uniref:diaminopimelate epimerase n=1 Tax=Streptomyces coelicoflavus TaxID=285562 RepID=UPI0024AE0CAC|nr:diaminopimelate epimerase [Streptomyces coelicoflavus]MDI6520356.1 diaminopimelate epimerase [Streptomyces coelicoflavus]
MTVAFRKVHGSGNDFLLVTGFEDEREWRALGPRVCARRTGVGADGLVVSTVVGEASAVLNVLCVNQDGSVATLCANALRCAAWCASLDHGWSTMSLVMEGIPHDAVVEGRHVRVTVEAGDVVPERVAHRHPGEAAPLVFDAVRVGAEHLVALVDDVERIDFPLLVRSLRAREPAAAGTNISVVQPLGDRELLSRTHENGAQEEALSCASGAVAAAVVAARRGTVEAGAGVTVHNRAGTPLTVTGHTERSSYWVGGPVTHVFDGRLDLA